MVHIAVSVGELIDKITILEIKKEEIKDEAKLLKVHYELEKLSLIGYRFITDHRITWLYVRLRTINNQLWLVEDKIRMKERDKEFDDEFIRLARAVYQLNDERFKIKNQINELSGSDIQEVKEYIEYDTGKKEGETHS